MLLVMPTCVRRGAACRQVVHDGLLLALLSGQFCAKPYLVTASNPSSGQAGFVHDYNSWAFASTMWFQDVKISPSCQFQVVKLRTVRMPCRVVLGQRLNG